jgi:hypothetical protein
MQLVFSRPVYATRSQSSQFAFAKARLWKTLMKGMPRAGEGLTGGIGWMDVFR